MFIEVRAIWLPPPPLLTSIAGLCPLWFVSNPKLPSTIGHGRYVDSRHWDQNGHSQNMSDKHYGKPRRYTTYVTSALCLCSVVLTRLEHGDIPQMFQGVIKSEPGQIVVSLAMLARP